MRGGKEGDKNKKREMRVKNYFAVHFNEWARFCNKNLPSCKSIVSSFLLKIET